MVLATNNKSLLFEFLRYLQNQIGKLTDNQNNVYTEEEKWKLEQLGGTAETLAAYAEENGDVELILLLDEFIYLINKTSMGNSFVVQAETVKFDHRLNDYAAKIHQPSEIHARLWRLE